MARIFKYQDNVYEDPGEEFSIEDVQKHLAQYFPELANATHSEKELESGDVEIVFAKKIGTKGGDRPHRYHVRGMVVWSPGWHNEIDMIVEAYNPTHAGLKALALHADNAEWNPDVPRKIDDLGEIPEDEWMRRIGQPGLPLEAA